MSALTTSGELVQSGPADAARVEIAAAAGKLAEIDGWLDRADIGDLPAALTWIKDAQALMKLRKQTQDLIIQAKRVEAKILRRLGLAGRKLDTPHLTNLAKEIAALSDADFREFIEHISNRTSVRTDLRDWRRDKDEQLARAERVQWARAGMIQDRSDADDSYENLRAAAGTIISTVLANRASAPVSDMVELLADRLYEDSGDQVVREGLSELLRHSLRNSGESNALHSRQFGSCAIPAHIAYRDGPTWVRVPWRVASLEQMLFQVEFREAQAYEVAESAKGLRATYELALSMLPESPESDVARELVSLARVKGLAHSYRDTDPDMPISECYERWPAVLALVENWSVRHAEELATQLATYDVHNESEFVDLPAEVRVQLLDKCRGSGRKTAESFIRAYAPEMAGTFSYPHEVSFVYGSDYSDDFRAQAVERARERHGYVGKPA